MNKLKRKIIIILIIICSFLLIFHRNLIHLSYKYEASKILRENHDNIKIKKVKVGKTESILGYSYPICKIDYKYNNNLYTAIININDKQIYDNYQYKEIYNNLSKEIISKFKTKYKNFNLDYNSEINFVLPDSFFNFFDNWQFNHFIKDNYNGNNINNLISEGTIILEFDTINASYEEIESFINKYNNKFDINIITEKEMTISNKKTSSKCVTNNIYSNTMNKKINIGDNCYRDINELRIVSEKSVVDNINIFQIPRFEFSSENFLNNKNYYTEDFYTEYEELFKNSNYKVISNYYQINNNFEHDMVDIIIKGKFDPNKKHLVVIQEFGDYSDITFERAEVTSMGIKMNFSYPKNIGFVVLEFDK